jgi:poly-gamma-glutamate capsule biosynthesis protein CapA/YwtB (metallophosphatase superfamily)
VRVSWGQWVASLLSLTGSAAGQPLAPPTIAQPTQAVAAAISSLPPPEAAASQRTRLVVVAGGDVSFGREAGQALLANPGYRPFRGLDAIWVGADVRFANLESQLSERGGETQSPYDRLVFSGPPQSADVLADSGVHVVSTANNHAWDYGKSALLETLLHLDRAGVHHAGTGATLDHAERPVVLVVNGWKIALFAVTRIWNQGDFARHPGRAHVAWDVKRLSARVATARAENDLVFVSYHGGAEYVNAPGGATLELTRQLMRAGADAIFGHHPHVIQGVGWHDQRPVFYSLGNLLFGSRRGYPWTRYGMLARLVFEADGERQVSICPFRIEIGSHEPHVLDGRYGAYDRGRFSRHFARVNAAVGKTLVEEGDAYGCAAIAAASAPRLQARAAALSNP